MSYKGKYTEKGGSVQMSDSPDVREDCTTCIAYAEGLRGPCYLHSPERAEERRRNNSKAAKSKANAELRRLKAEVREIIAEVREGTRDRNDATALFQGYRVMRDLIELERRIKETDELAQELAELKEQVEHEL
jgi:hypothetical protein